MAFPFLAEGLVSRDNGIWNKDVFMEEISRKFCTGVRGKQE